LPTAGLFMVGEYFLPIRFQLLGLRGTRIEEIRSVYSHVHALGQCRKIIRRLGLVPHITADTAGSAREIAEWKDKTRASLATKLAAEIYDLDVLAADVEDEKHNTTRFVVLSKSPQWPDAENGPCVTSFIFRVRNVPAALYKALGGFATNGINMTKLESYMVEGEFTATQFLADVEGHPDDPPLARALEELAFFCKEFKILGVYPAHQFRIESEKQREA
jgi:prephenate dehydratase